MEVKGKRPLLRDIMLPWTATPDGTKYSFKSIGDLFGPKDCVTSCVTRECNNSKCKLGHAFSTSGTSSKGIAAILKRCRKAMPS